MSIIRHHALPIVDHKHPLKQRRRWDITKGRVPQELEEQQPRRQEPKEKSLIRQGAPTRANFRGETVSGEIDGATIYVHGFGNQLIGY
jgi:hypothetical protein